MPAKKTKKLSFPGLEFHHGKYRWRRMINGRRHTFNLQATSEGAAIAEAVMIRNNSHLYDLGSWEIEMEAYLKNGLASGKISSRNADNRRNALRLIKRKMAVDSPRMVTPSMVQRWLDSEIEAHPGSTTPGSYLQHLRAFFKHLLLIKKIPSDPLLGIEGPKIQKRLRDTFLPTEKVIELLASARASNNADLEWILALGLECGMRRGEIASARAEWFDLKAGTVTIPAVDVEVFKRKGREGRRRSATIPLSDPVLDLISRTGLRSPFVVNPTKGWGKAQYRYDFRKILKTVLKDHGCGHVTIHDLRRSFGSNRVSAGVSIEKVANWMGIDPETAWKHYARFIPADAEINRGAAIKTKPAEESKAAVEPAERLKRLKGLFDQGLITEEEFQTKRDEIIAAL